jgi:hypothetical protein
MLSSQQYDVEQKEICTLFFEFPPTETQKVYLWTGRTPWDIALQVWFCNFRPAISQSKDHGPSDDCKTSE